MLTLTGIESGNITITEEASAKRDSLLVLAKSLPVVTNAQEAQTATDALREITSFTKLIEASRTEVKAPVLDLGKRIDNVAKNLTTELEAERVRISKAIGTWQAEQQRLLDKARREAAEEERRIAEEAEAKIRAAQESSKSEAAFDRKVEKIEDKAFQQVAEVRASVGAMVAEKPVGLATRNEVCFEVTDINELYEAAPAFVILSPNNAAIKAALKTLPEGKSLPGVRHWKEARSFVR